MQIPESLRVPASRESSRRFHILVMSEGGGTRRFSLSTTFLWVMASIVLLVLLALGVLSYLASSLLVDNRNLQDRYDFELRRLETQAYNRVAPEGPEAAARLLDILDRAALSAGDDYSELPEPFPEDADPPEGDPPAQTAGPAPDPDPARTGEGPGAAGAAADPAAGGAAPGGEAPTAAGGAAPGEGGGAAAGVDAPSAGDGAAVQAEAEAWEAFHRRLPSPPAEQILDVDEFRFSPEGSYSFYLKQAAGPGERLRGRAAAVFAVQERDGRVRLVADPEFDLRVPSQGWERGGRYNILASKVYRGRVRIPQGGRALSAEILAWDEDTKELVLRKGVPLDGEG